MDVQTSLTKTNGVIAATLLIIVLIAGLVGCAAGGRADGAASSAAASGASSEVAQSSAPAPTGHVSAKLPPQNPEVLVPNPTPDTQHSFQRIVTLDRAGALSRMVWTLGLGDRLVGRDTASDFPGIKDLPQITPGGHSINAESLLALKPDLVLTDGSIGPSRVIQKLKDAGVEVVSVPQDRTPDTIDVLIDAVADAVGLSNEAEGVKAHIAKHMAAATKRAQDRADGRKMMVLYVRGTGVAMIAGPESGGRALIEYLGGIDAGEKLGIQGSFTPLTPEALIAAAPETLIVMTAGLESVGGVDGLLEVPGVNQTPAGKNRSVLDVPDSQLLSFGSETPRVIDAMAEVLYGN